VIELQRLIHEQGVAAGEAYCHSLKGVCGNLGANELFARLSELDGSLQAGRMPESWQFDHLQQLLQRVMADIDSAGLSVLAPIARAEPLDRDALLAKLAALVSLLDSDLGAAEQALSDLRSGVAGTDLEAAVADIAAQMEVFATDEAAALIGRLQTRLSLSP
jgi:HPt (histidine-containing phosphotransfer) domain-containing protein